MRHSDKNGPQYFLPHLTFLSSVSPGTPPVLCQSPKQIPWEDQLQPGGEATGLHWEVEGANVCVMIPLGPEGEGRSLSTPLELAVGSVYMYHEFIKLPKLM